MRGRGNRFGGALSLDLGVDVALDPPEDGVAFVTPTLTEWHYASIDLGFSSGAKVEMINNITAGTPCSVTWKIQKVDGKNTYVYNFTPTSPEANSPHYAIEYITDPLHRGFWYDLYWSWAVSGHGAGPNTLVAAAAIWVPNVGGGPGSG